MQVFISWSGQRSRAVAEALRTWLPRVVQSVRPWMSQEDITAGSRWLAEVSNLLDSAQVGILCITPENQHNPWLLFEAGALSKSLDQSRVCPLLFDMTPGQLSGPVTQFQAQYLDQAGMLRILITLNNQLDENRLAESELAEILNVWWPHLATELAAIGPVAAPPVSRSTQEQLDELLSIGREQLRRENIRLESNKTKDVRMDQLIEMMGDSMNMIGTFDKRSKKLQDNFKSVGGVLAKLEESGASSPEIMDELMKALMPGNMSPVIDIKAMKKMQSQMAEFQSEQRKTIEDLLANKSLDVGQPPQTD